MYAYLKGQLVELSPTYTILDVTGHGYYIHTPLTVFNKSYTIGQEILLYTTFIVREDSMRLFGFVRKKDQILFEQLIAISGLGPKIALSILSQGEKINFSQMIIEKDTQALTKIPGIGKKTAERIIIDLSDKIKNIPLEKSTSPLIEDAICALINLGYKEKEAQKNVFNSIKKKPIHPRSL